MALGISGAAIQSGVAWAGEAENTGQGNGNHEIVVRGANDESRFLAGLLAESELDENGIAAYGLDNVGDLLAEVLTQVGGSNDGPIILINGQISNGISEVSDLPTEAVSKIQLLPRQAAGQLGQNPGRRVINVVIKSDLRQFTGNVSAGFATAGQGLSATAEINLLALANGNRRSFVLKARHSDPLFEADRDILNDSEGTPYDFIGNVVSYPYPGSNIDPALSALAGQPVLVAGANAATTSPTLADFAARANRANFSDLGRYRTLLARQRGISANANFTQKLSAVTSLSLNLAADRSYTRGFTGASTADLRLPGGTPFSPFASDVLLARYLGPPLTQTGNSTALTFAANLNTRAGGWRISLSANFSHRIGHTASERGIDTAALATKIANGTVNPFAILPASLVSTILADKARSSADNGNAQLLVNGSPFNLPAGPVTAALRLEWRGNRSSSETIGGATNFSTHLRRDEESAQLALQLPVLGSTSPIGALGFELSGALRHVTAAGGLEEYGYGVNWLPVSAVTLRAAVNHEQLAPSPNALTDAVITLDGVRTFDFIRQETVFVRYVSGGNPNLGVEQRRSTTVSATFVPFAAANFTLNAEYWNVVGRDSFAALPPVNAEVQAAFPDRFQRDIAGRLIAVDARPVPFARVKREYLRWGATFSRSFGRTVRPAAASGDSEGNALSARWRLNGYINHEWTITSSRLARAGLPEVDLLAGGALGYGGGQPRHMIQFGGGVVRSGIGLQVNGTWKGGSRIAAGTVAAPDEIRFAPRTTIDVRLFGNLGPLFPSSRLAKGMRIALSVDNLFDSKDRVTDASGSTPNRYQPYLLDPLGRTISFSLRKVI